ncbi:sulfurtransferase TusB [Erwinia sp. OLTSP20]|uniref:sulfurtransferase complex subunit TusB n=1 Tax=unclassified Erwinia TaxID=2622719 RepID=UPI000C183444|nr:MULTISPECIES: sulfurtransferase complex subunit TusB [unclassified Erwinia]PIJ51232.1 sulfurtransferase TusB [Erwinia sp. OAMSP11]PIJ73985.1 sulfurtransferase TusB [Erwinia sp. OLSSP12]PIJ83993.1 sulfurtransferase TusB [Erwinia sp. OLCASP19]PIJ86523.1 sulfurtransferase TusB [Erwinia sp. OLMTSP26]PIJ88002.1 sulfurtransferase TusB [Erwinia sp. OLMDSP33]
MLHTLRHSPFQCDFSALLRMLGPDDDLLMLEDGVIAALSATESLRALQASGAALFALGDDLVARGLSRYIPVEIRLVDYNGFVALAVKNPQQMVW